MSKNNHDIELASRDLEYRHKLWKELDLLDNDIKFPFGIHPIPLQDEASLGAVVAVAYRDCCLVSPKGFLITPENEEDALKTVHRARMALAVMSTIRSSLGIPNGNHWFLKQIAYRAQHEVAVAFENLHQEFHATLKKIAHRFVINGIDVCIPRRTVHEVNEKHEELARLPALALLRSTRNIQRINPMSMKGAAK